MSRFSKNASSTARRELPRRESKGLSVLTARKLKLATVVTRAAQRFGSNWRYLRKIQSPALRLEGGVALENFRAHDEVLVGEELLTTTARGDDARVEVARALKV